MHDPLHGSNYPFDRFVNTTVKRGFRETKERERRDPFPPPPTSAYPAGTTLEAP